MSGKNAAKKKGSWWIHCRGAARSIALGSFFCVAVVAVRADASDSNTYNGAFCRAETGSGGTVVYDAGDSSIKNSHTSTDATVVCPIARDNTLNGDGWDEILVGVFDRNSVSGKNVTCTGFAFSTSGAQLWNEAQSSSGSAGSGWTVLPIDDPMSDSDTDSYYLIRCSIPGRTAVPTPDPSGVAFYRVQEP